MSGESPRLTKESDTMYTIEEQIARFGRIERLSGGRWVRLVGDDPQLVAQVQKETGITLPAPGTPAFAADGEVTHLAVGAVERDHLSYSETRIAIAVSADTVVTVEPLRGCASLDLAVTRMARDSRDDDTPIEITASILQAIADTTDELVGSLSDGTEHMMTQTSAILHSLETKKAREFGVSDVTTTQQELADMEELLSHCMEHQLVLAEAARHLRGHLRVLGGEARTDLARLIDDIEAIEPHIDFVHDRVRLLQQTNNLALNVKQNQIIKVFSVVTAVFLPVMLLSTYYSMNFEYMPILSWDLAEPAIIVLSFVFAMLPLIYVRRRGWLR